MKKIVSLVLALALLLAAAPAFAAQTAYRALYNAEDMPDWAPSYGLSAPGMLLHLNKQNADIYVIAYENIDALPSDHINGILSGYADYLNITSTIGPGLWSDPWNGEGRYMDITYKYVNGDETYRELIYVAKYQTMLIEISFTAWGESAEADAAAFKNDFLDENFDIASFDIDTTACAYLSDVLTGSEGQVQMLVSFFEAVYDEATNGFSTVIDDELYLYDVSSDAMIWFPSANDLAASYRVEVDADAIARAVLDFEENTGASPAFNLVFKNGQIIWMDYYYLP